MSDERRWSVIPRSRPLCLLWIVVGALVLTRTIWRMSDSASPGILEIVAAVLAGLLVLTSLIGLFVPRLRER